MTSRLTRRALQAGCLGAALGAYAHTVRAQEVVPVHQDAAQHTVEQKLNKTFAIHIKSMALRDALALISAKTGVDLAFAPDVPVMTRPVSLDADEISLRDALAVLLLHTGLQPVPSESGAIRLEPTTATSVLPARYLTQQGTATISGSVRDSGTGAVIPQVTVHVDGTQLSAKSSADGQYKIMGLAAGEYRVTARRVGYLAKTRTITLADGDTKTLDFGLNPPATKLNEVVTTALGDQRRYEVGNVVATINVDSIAPDVPATSVTDILSGRVPGVEVMESSGLVGGGEDIRIRGQASLLLQADPIIIVDGIRVDNAPGGAANGTGLDGLPSPSRINDLDFSQIETINILKGAAATTEYGTDAANGVIVITTKRGVSGRAQWSASAEEATSSVPVGYQNYYTSWGHFTSGAGQPTYCDLVDNYYGQVGASTSGDCVVDSVTAFNPLNVPAYSMFDAAPSSRYNLAVSGGSDQLRYALMGAYNSAIGSVHLPDVFHSEAIALGVPNSELDPNSLDQRSLRANTSIRLNTVTDVNVSVAYLSTYQEEPNVNDLMSNLGDSPSLPDSAHNFGYGFDPESSDPGSCVGSCTANGSPLGAVGQLESFSTQRWTGVMSANWRPVGWFAGAVDMGVDHGVFADQDLVTAQANVLEGGSGQGQLGEFVGTNDVYTVNLRGNITATLLHVRAITSFGANYVDNRYNALSSSEYDLTTSPYVISGGSNVNTSEAIYETVTDGAYVEENFGFGDRCYVPIALRFDTGSGFGAAVAGTGGEYPKWGLSCLVLTGRTTLRLRAAYGEAGQQPPYGASLPTYNDAATTWGAGQQVITDGYQLITAGNTDLKPQRSAQTEAGLDLGLWNGRVNVEGSWYTTYTTNMLWRQQLGWELNGLSFTENIGNVRNTGWEASVSATVFQQRSVAWTVNVNTSINTNKLLTLAPGLLTTNIGEGEYFAVGYPLYGYWDYPEQYTNPAHDGIITQDDVTESDTLGYIGSSAPRQETSFSSAMGFLNGRIQVQALFDMRSSFVIAAYGALNCSVYCEASNLPGAPQNMQAVQAYQNVTGLGSLNYFNGAYIRFRELSVSVNAPRRWLRATHFSTASLVGGVRNLALWTRYPFGDPEVSGPGGDFTVQNAASGTQSPQNDLRYAALTAVPLVRSFDLRLNLGL